MQSKKNTLTAKLDIKLAPKLKTDLENQGFEITKIPYSIFSAKKKGISLTLYESGSLVVQGKQKDEFIEFYLEPEILKSFEYTHPTSLVSMEPRIGVDEAGKGDFFGPLCIAGVYADKKGIEKLISLNVKDSKKLADKTVLKLAKIISQEFQVTIVRVFPEKYNELYLKFKNLNTLLAWGHTSVISKLVEKSSCKNVIIDKFASEYVVASKVKKKGLDINLTQRTKAEEDPVVAAAAILARAAFVKGIEELSDEYGIILPKGASKAVIDAGKRFVNKCGGDNLEKVAKIHFKTKDQII